MSVAVAATEADEFIGLTKHDCPIDCGPDRCVISGAPICSHPRKAGLQAAFQADPATVRRYGRAKKALLIAETRERTSIDE